MSELSDQDLEAIEEIHNHWIREELVGNNSAIIELCTDDVRWLPPNAPPLVGKTAVAKYLNDNSVDLKDVQVGDVVISGGSSVVYLTSNYCSRFMIDGNSKMQEAVGAHLWILRKTMDGRWRVAIVAWSSWKPGKD